jgi:hypothetical protein
MNGGSGMAAASAGYGYVLLLAWNRKPSQM